MEAKFSSSTARIGTIRDRYITEATVTWTTMFRSTWDSPLRSTPMMSPSWIFWKGYMRSFCKKDLWLLNLAPWVEYTSDFHAQSATAWYSERYVRSIISAAIRWCSIENTATSIRINSCIPVTLTGDLQISFPKRPPQLRLWDRIESLFELLPLALDRVAIAESTADNVSRTWVEVSMCRSVAGMNFVWKNLWNVSFRVEFLWMNFLFHVRTEDWSGNNIWFYDYPIKLWFYAYWVEPTTLLPWWPLRTFGLFSLFLPLYLKCVII